MNCTVLITGASRGLGFEFAKQYAEKGWDVLATCRNPDESERLHELKEKHPSVSLYKLDVTDEAQIQALSEALKDRVIDRLINVAGIKGDTTNVTIGNFSIANAQTVLLTNAIGPFKVTEAFIERVAASSLKSVVVISGRLGSIQDNQRGGAVAYRMSKTALHMGMQEFRIKNPEIDLKFLSPGWVKTDMGGTNATLEVADCVDRLIHVIETPTKSGGFYDYNGDELPW